MILGFILLYGVNDLFFGSIEFGLPSPTRLIVETDWHFFVRCLSYTLLETVPGFGDAALLVISVAYLPHFDPIF